MGEATRQRRAGPSPLRGTTATYPRIVLVPSRATGNVGEG